VTVKANTWHPKSLPGLVWCGPLLCLVPCRWVAPPLKTGVVGLYLVQGVWFLIYFAARGNWSYPDYSAVTGNPSYPWYKTLIVAPKPSIEWVAGASHLRDGRIGTHMIL
jgi:hypothetical protein